MKNKHVKIRDWKQDEVPVGATIKFKDGCRAVISATAPDGTILCGNRWHRLESVLKIADGYSTDTVGLNDAYRTWLPCGIIES
jgi:hypothetical protein